MIGWHHQLNEHEFKQTLGDSEGQDSLVCMQSMGLQSRTWLSNNIEPKGIRWGGKWEEDSEIQDGGLHLYNYGQFMLIYGKHYNIVLILQLK